MDLGWTSGAATLTALVLSVIGVIAAVAKSLMWFNSWAAEDKIGNSLDRMDTKLAVAARLEAIGEPTWAAETREEAWMEPL